jgi:hypothetical protein
MGKKGVNKTYARNRNFGSANSNPNAYYKKNARSLPRGSDVSPWEGSAGALGTGTAVVSASALLLADREPDQKYDRFVVAFETRFLDTLWILSAIRSLTSGRWAMRMIRRTNSSAASKKEYPAGSVARGGVLPTNDSKD